MINSLTRKLYKHNNTPITKLPIRTFSSESENELSIVTRQDQIINKGEYVYRPSGNWTKDVHKFLGYLHDKGFGVASKPLGFGKTGREIVTIHSVKMPHLFRHLPRLLFYYVSTMISPWGF